MNVDKATSQLRKVSLSSHFLDMRNRIADLLFYILKICARYFAARCTYCVSYCVACYNVQDFIFFDVAILFYALFLKVEIQ